MSLIPSHKTTDSPKKNLYENVKEVDLEKSLEVVDAFDSATRSAGGAGETPVKRPVKKPVKAEDEKTGKKITPSVTDKIPKKNAQRARGSIALNKTIAEKANAENAEKKRHGYEGNDVSPAKDGGCVENAKGGTDGRRTPVSVRHKDSKIKAGAKKGGKKDPKSVKRHKPWMDAVEKQSNEMLKTEGTLTKQEPTEMQGAEMHPLSPPLATCSFFEKLQQGVKSYFSSKNSFTPYDKVNKEGGNQTRARVAKGVKEDTKKRDPGLIVKNDICSSESDSFHDELRLNSSLGGQSNSFSRNKPKIFRMLKRKKLYHPKKHYVRIQIPRKGYFYRSTVRLKAPGSAASGQFERMEPQGVPKSESKVQISGMASPSSKVSNLPNKKRVNRKQINSENDCNQEKDCVLSQYLDQMFSDHKKPGYSFHQLINNHIILHQPCERSNFNEKKKLESENELVLNLINWEQEGEKQTNAMSENSWKSDSRKTKKCVKKKVLSGENDSSEVFAKVNKKVCPAAEKKKKTPRESTFETLINCITSTLGNEKFMYDLEISPVSTKELDEKKFAYNLNTLQTLTSAPLDFTEITTTFNNFESDLDLDCENLVEPDYFYELPVTPAEYCTPKSELSRTLMEEIDLHLELQNYLKEYKMMNKSKSKSKQEKEIGSYVSFPSDKNDFSKAKECKSRSSFKSASSIRLQEEKSANQLRMFRDMISVSEECIKARPKKEYNVQNESKSSEIRKIKSENDPGKLPQDAMQKSFIKRTFGKTSFQMIHLEENDTSIPRGLPSFTKNLPTEDSIESYEKITPFIANSSKSNDSKTKNLSRVLFENAVYSQSADSVSQSVREVSSDVQQLDNKTSDQFRVVEPDPQIMQNKSSNTEIVSSDFNQVESSSKWSPTLKDIIDIYNNVLKQNKRAKKGKKNSVKDSLSSHLINFLNEKLQQKQLKANLMELSKDFGSTYKAPSNWKPINIMSESVNVKEYVSIFQEILQSSLSITQIARLNNIISDLQKYAEKYETVKDSKMTVDAETETKKKLKKNCSAGEKTETSSKKVNTKKQPKSFFLSKTKAEFSVDAGEKTPKLAKPPRIHSEANLKTKNGKTEKMKISSKEKICENELEFMLKTCFDSVNVLCNEPAVSSPNNKVLVTVKLSGNRILVNDLSYINGEDTFACQETKSDDTSELIIESITKDQLRDAWFDTKCSKLKLKRPQVKETSKNLDLKGTKLGTPKTKKLQGRSEESKTKETICDRETEESCQQELLSMHQCKQSKIVYPFEYDQMQLRAQHPIEAIIESSESKVSEIFEISEKEKLNSKVEIPPAEKSVLNDTPNNSTAIKVALKEALGENIFSKDLVRNFVWSKDEIGGALGRTKSSVISRHTAKRRSTKKKELAETVRSMVDLNRRPCFKRKGRKVPPSRLREAYVCYPSAFSLQEKSLKSLPKTKEKLKEKKLINRYSPLKTTAKVSIPHTKLEVPKKMSQDVCRRPKAEVTPSAQMLDSNTAQSIRVGQNLEKLSSKTQTCNVEVLLGEKMKSASPLSITSHSEKQGSISSSQQHPSSFQRETPNPKQASEFFEQNVKESPITLYSAKNSSIDDISFPAMVIHSDSFLKSFSQFALTKSKLKSLFKSNSDMKFFPGRITKNGSEDRSFITFVLTPEQNKTAGLLTDKVQVVTKSPAVNDVDAALSSTQASIVRSEDQLDEIDETKSLKAIEQFIDQYSKCRKKAAKRRQFNEMKKAERKQLFQSSSLFKRGLKNVGTPSILGFPSERKIYHECQKKKKTLKRIDMKTKKGMKVPDKTRIIQLKKRKSIEKKANVTEKAHLFFPNKIKDFIKVLENFEKSAREEREKMLKQAKQNVNTETDCQKKATETDSKEDNDGEEGIISKNSANFFPEVLEVVKTALNQVDDLRNKSEIISIIEKELEKKKEQFYEKASDNLSKQPPTPKKLKFLKMKIHCIEQKSSEEDESVEKSAECLLADSRFVKPPSPILSLLSPRPQPMGEIELLNSLVLREEEGGEGQDLDLERRNSIYFDALEKTWPDDIGGAGEEMGDSQRMFHKASEGNLNLNEESDVREESKSSLHPLFTKSVENLFSKNYFSKESEEIIMNKITASLKESKIPYSIALLDEFMKKIENSSDQESKCFKLKKMLLMIENKNRNLMLKMEKKAWLKVLSLLEEVSQIFDHESFESSMRDHLQITKAFIDKIQELNASRLTDLQNFCCSLSQQPSAKTDERNLRNVFGRIRESVNFFKQKFIFRRDSSQKKVEKAVNHEIQVTNSNINQDGESKFKVHSTLSLADARGNLTQHHGKDQVEHLKKKIQQQKACLQQLMEPDMDFTPQEILEVKDKVAKKIKWLGKMFEGYSSGGSSKNPTTEVTSLLNTTQICKKCDAGRSKDKSVSKNLAYSDLMQSLIKVWDKSGT